MEQQKQINTHKTLHNQKQKNKQKHRGCSSNAKAMKRNQSRCSTKFSSQFFLAQRCRHPLSKDFLFDPRNGSFGEATNTTNAQTLFSHLSGESCHRKLDFVSTYSSSSSSSFCQKEYYKIWWKICDIECQKIC